MIRYSPWPYRDEVIGSLAIRICRHLGLTVRQFNWEVFGTHGARLPLLMSSHLDRFAELTRIEPDKLLSEHTVFPYAAAFLPKSRADRLRRSLVDPRVALSPDAQILKRPIGRVILQLRVCKTCVKVELDSLGESYWHRVHLLPGVLVCPLHEQMLRKVCKSDPAPLMLPHETITEPIAPPIDVARLLKIAIRTQSALEDRTTSLQVSAAKYRSLARKAGYELNARMISVGKLGMDVSSHYGPAYLSMTNAELPRSINNAWPSMMVRRSAARPYSPIRHILLQEFLRNAAAPDPETAGPSDSRPSPRRATR